MGIDFIFYKGRDIETKLGAFMKKLRHGVHKFQKEVFGEHKKLFKKLEAGQDPHTLFITCSDSRINPNLLTQTKPGDIFILRNAGNMVPKYDERPCGESATIEFAVSGLGIKNIVLCGHSNCGAMKGLLEPQSLKTLPSVAAWLLHAGMDAQAFRKLYNDRPEDELLNILIQENVLHQLENLRTHPSIRQGLKENRLNIYLWVYKIPTGEVFSYDFLEEQFLPLAEANLAKPGGLNSEYSQSDTI